jgi:hypothetical protein
MGANQNSLRGGRGPRKLRDEITEFDFAPIWSVLREALFACLPSQVGQTIDQVLPDLLVRIAAGWPRTKIGDNSCFRQSLVTVETRPDFLWGRRSTVDWNVHLIRTGLRLLQIRR